MIATVVLAPVALCAIVALAFGSGEQPVGPTRLSLAHATDELVHRVGSFGVDVEPAASSAAAAAAVRSGAADAAADVRDGRVEVLAVGRRPVAGAVAALAVSGGDRREAPSVAKARRVGRTEAARAAPALGVALAVLILLTSAKSFWVEQRLGIYHRTIGAGLSARHALIGKVMAASTVALGSLLATWAWSSMLFRTSWGRPGAVTAAIVLTVVAAAVVTALVIVVSGSDERADHLVLATAFALAVLGGVFDDPARLPSALRSIGRFTPNGWSADLFARLQSDGTEAATAIASSLTTFGMFVAVGCAACTALTLRWRTA